MILIKTSLPANKDGNNLDIMKLNVSLVKWVRVRWNRPVYRRRIANLWGKRTVLIHRKGNVINFLDLEELGKWRVSDPQDYNSREEGLNRNPE